MTCLVQCFEIKNYINHLSPMELENFLHLKTITEQFLFLRKLSYIPLEISDLFKVNTWKDLEKFCEMVIVDGIILFWCDLHYSGHALPVTNGKISWLPFDKNTELSQYLTNLTVCYIKKKVYK